MVRRQNYPPLANDAKLLLSTSTGRKFRLFLHGLNMTNLRGSAAYKKKDGTLTISSDGQSVSWMPVAPLGSPPALVIQVSNITSEALH